MITYMPIANAATISSQAWSLYNKLPTPTSTAEQESSRLRRELLRLKKELGAVSAQDDFAKWAKLRRQHDKVLSEHEKNCMISLPPSIYRIRHLFRAHATAHVIDADVAD